MNLQCATDIARQYGLELSREGNCFRAECPVCGLAKLTFAPSKHATGYYFASNCGCYSQGSHHTGSGANLDYWLRQLGAVGQAQPTFIPAAPRPAPTLDKPMMARIAHGAMARLVEGSVGAKYLSNRGLVLATAKAWRFGFGFWCKYEFQSIVIPWYAPDHTLVSISHRLINPTDDQPKAPWQNGMAGRTNGLLNGWHTHTDRPTLIIVEGVLNAPSLWQACNDFADVLTPGSENTNPATWPLEQLHRWDRVIIWADEPDKAKVWAKALGTKLRIASQPTGNKAKTDANDLLKRGQLREFIKSGLQ